MNGNKKVLAYLFPIAPLFWLMIGGQPANPAPLEFSPASSFASSLDIMAAKLREMHVRFERTSNSIRFLDLIAEDKKFDLYGRNVELFGNDTLRATGNNALIWGVPEGKVRQYYRITMPAIDEALLKRTRNFEVIKGVQVLKGTYMYEFWRKTTPTAFQVTGALVVVTYPDGHQTARVWTAEEKENYDKQAMKILQARIGNSARAGVRRNQDQIQKQMHDLMDEFNRDEYVHDRQIHAR